jgi:ABC-type antimicrobial peptide transport system permease subunit
VKYGESVGVRRRAILNQFPVESSLLARTGGGIGVLLAWGIAFMIPSSTILPMTLPGSAVIVGVGLSTAIGPFFEVYSVVLAAQPDPIEGLRAKK